MEITLQFKLNAYFIEKNNFYHFKITKDMYFVLPHSDKEKKRGMSKWGDLILTRLLKQWGNCLYWQSIVVTSFVDTSLFRVLLL